MIDERHSRIEAELEFEAFLRGDPYTYTTPEVRARQLYNLAKVQYQTQQRYHTDLGELGGLLGLGASLFGAQNALGIRGLYGNRK